MGRSSYPGTIDSDVEIPRVEDNITEIGAESINSLRDAIFSIENTIGINPQGNMEDLVTRINESIDANGHIKLSALQERGLITLPITNSHISTSAAIEEIKLDLDYPTATLNGKISSNIVDIDTLRTTFNVLISQFTKHFGGTEYKHDGYHIDLTQPIRSSEDVETIINVLNNAFTSHEQSAIGAHKAYGISTNDEFINFSANNVQSALIELDNLGSTVTEDHQDKGHSTGIILNDRGEQGDQGNLKETTLAGTIFQTETSKATNIFQVMRPNVARVTSKNLDLHALSVGSAQYLRIQAGGIGRSYLDVNLQAIIPTDDLDEVVAAINTKAQGCEEHYPISAYNTGGNLTIAHTMPGKEFTIQILDSVQFSAATALGFGIVTGTVFEWTKDVNGAYIGGQKIFDMKSFVKRHYIHNTKPLNTLALGLGDLSELGITIGNEGRLLCNITNHSTSSDYNGTHYILGFPNDESIVLSSDIALGEFDIEIPADALNFENSANGEIFDIFVEPDGDGYGVVTKSLRVQYHPISGVDIKAISKDFPTSGVEWQISDATKIYLHKNGDRGISSDIPSSFRGELRAYAPDNINSALFEVIGIPSSSRETMDVFAFNGTDDKLHIASVHYSGNWSIETLKYSVDHRSLGTSINGKSEDTLNPIPIEDTTKELRNNGIIRGFEYISHGNDYLKIRGGRALVDGRIVEVNTKDVEVDDLSASQKLLLLDRYGNYIIKTEYDSGFTFEELTSGDGYGDDRGVAIIGQFEANGSSIDGYFVDRRLMVNKLDKKIVDLKTSLEQKVTQIRNTVQGSSWGFTVTEASGGIDGYLASIEMGSNNGFSYIPDQYETPLSARGFGAGSAIITTRRFEFSDPDTIQTTIFRAIGLTHLNVFIELIYTGIKAGINGPFGVSGTVYIDVGIATERGMENLTVSEAYATVKTIYTGVLPSKSQTERYVVSIPVSELGLPENIMFDVVPRVRIVNSNYVDGGPGSDPEPTIRFDNVRIVTSSYSIAGAINEVDGSSTSISATVGEIF